MLWFNGGPGSSSVLGMLQEQGPLLMARQGGLHVNPWAWSTVANFLVFESPAGVGYSYCDATRHHKPCVNTDNSTADAAHSALLDFFGDAKFPELRNNAFSSRASRTPVMARCWRTRSHHGAMLARRVLDANDAGVTPRVNLRSIAVGDPCTDNDSQLDAMDTLWYSRKYGLVDEADFDLLWSKCGMRFPSLIALGGFTAGEKQRSFSHRHRQQRTTTTTTATTAQTATAQATTTMTTTTRRRELRPASSSAEPEVMAVAAAGYRPAHGWLRSEAQRPIAGAGGGAASAAASVATPVLAAHRPAEAAAAKAEERAAAMARAVEMAKEANAATSVETTATATAAERKQTAAVEAVEAEKAVETEEEEVVELAVSCRAAERRFLLGSSRGLSQTWP